METPIEKAISELNKSISTLHQSEYIRGLKDAIVVLNNLLPYQEAYHQKISGKTRRALYSRCARMILSSGVFDINGEELCEGDTVHIIHFKESEYKYKISYENGCFWLNHIKLKNFDDTPLKWGAIYRVAELGYKMKKIQP